MSVRFIFTLFLALCTTSVFAQAPATGPHINSGGPAFEVANRDVPLREGHKYRVVFEATDYPGEVTDANREFTLVARFLNMHGKNGVPLEDMDIAVVIHGQTLMSTLR